MHCEPLPSPDPTVDTDLPCVSCGYNLKTLSTEGRCPECGSRVADSMEGGGPHLAWLATVREGADGMIFGLASLFATALLLLVGTYVEAAPFLPAAGVCLTAAAYGTTALGTYQLTARAPVARGRRAVARIARLLALTIWVPLPLAIVRPFAWPLVPMLAIGSIPLMFTLWFTLIAVEVRALIHPPAGGLCATIATGATATGVLASIAWAAHTAAWLGADLLSARLAFQAPQRALLVAATLCTVLLLLAMMLLVIKVKLEMQGQLRAGGLG